MSFDGICPCCGAQMIWQSDFEHVNDKIFSDFYCPECEAELLCPCIIETEDPIDTTLQDRYYKDCNVDTIKFNND